MRNNQYKLLIRSTSKSDEDVRDGENGLLLQNMPDHNHQTKTSLNNIIGTGLKSRGSWKSPGINTHQFYNENESDKSSHSGNRSLSAESRNRTKNGSPSDPNMTYIERKIHKDDSLRNLALQYGITVADLKRVNGLLTEQEFYGRDVLKIPVRKYGRFIENVDRPDQPISNVEQLVEIDLISHGQPPNEHSNVNLLDHAQSINVPSTSLLLDSNLNKTHFTTTHDKSAKEDLLQKVDQNLQKAKQHVEQQRRDDVTTGNDSLADVDIYATAARKSNLRSSWWQRNVTHFFIVILLIFIVILIPLCLLLYKILSN